MIIKVKVQVKKGEFNMVNKKFGKKIHELLSIVDNTKDWKNYVSEQTVTIINTVQEKNNIIEVLEELDMKYTTAHAHLIRAIKRIQEKDVEFLRDGKSPNAQKLFELMNNKGWKKNLTVKEVQITESFKKHKNFYDCGKELKIAPSNVAAILYGNKQKKGVIKKIEEYVMFINSKPAQSVEIEFPINSL